MSLKKLLTQSFVLVGPPGSGKGTYGSLLSKKYSIPIYTASDFIRSSTSSIKINDLTLKEYISKGNLLPDSIIGDIVQEGIAAASPGTFITDGYPRSLGQAQQCTPSPSSNPPNTDTNIPVWKNKNQHVKYALNIALPSKHCVSKIFGRRKCSKCNSTFNTSGIDEDGWVLPAILPASKIDYNDIDGNGCSVDKCQVYWETRDDDVDPTIVRKRLDDYEHTTSKVLDFYDEMGRLFVFEPRTGMEGFEELCDTVERAEEIICEMEVQKEKEREGEGR